MAAGVRIALGIDILKDRAQRFADGSRSLIVGGHKDQLEGLAVGLEIDQPRDIRVQGGEIGLKKVQHWIHPLLRRGGVKHATGLYRLTGRASTWGGNRVAFDALDAVSCNPGIDPKGIQLAWRRQDRRSAGTVQ